MKAIGALLLITGFFVSVLVQADDSTIILKWSSIPDRMEAHEVYIRNEKALYLVRRDSVEMAREDAVPKWVTRELSREELMRIADALSAIAGELDKTKEEDEPENPNRRFCHGFVWALDINVGEYNVQYHANCDPSDVRDRVQQLVKSAIGDPLVQ